MPGPAPASSTTLADRLAAALAGRRALLARLHAEDTDTYRLFHGTVEGWPGLTVDRYGDLVLAQTFHRPLAADEEAEIAAFYAEAFPGLDFLYNDRSAGHSRIANALPPEREAVATKPREARELGVRYRIRGRHAGQDPWLFLDLRAARRRVLAEAAGKSVLNLFAYTCGVGTAAAKAGAREVVNVDFAASSLAVGEENARLNAPLNARSIAPQFVLSDAFAAMRQLAGIGQPAVVRGRRLPPFPKLARRRFDLVFLDPPRYAKSPFGVVDLVNDYPALFKPALLCVEDGGALFCCNNVAEVDRDAWLDQLERSARKAGRPLSGVEWIAPEEDFPSPDGRPPLKMLRLAV